MTEGSVRVSEGGQEAVVDAPSLNGEIVVDLDAGPSGGGMVHVPPDTATLHREDEHADSDELEEARTDGGHARPADRVTVRGTGLNEDHALIAMILGVFSLLIGVSGSGTEVAGGIIGGLGLMYLGGRSYFTLRATGGDDA